MMSNKFTIILAILVLIGLTTPTYARNNSDEFGFGLYSIGYYFPLLSENINFKSGDFDVDTNFEGQNDLIHNIQFTYGITTKVFFQLSAGYYQGSMDVVSEYQRNTEERSEYVSLEGNNDFKIMPISFGLGYSFLKEGKFDPYASLGITFFRIKVDKIDLDVDEIVVKDNATGARIPSAEKDLAKDFIDTFIERKNDTELGLYLNLGMNYFFTDNFAWNTEFRYYHGTANLYEVEHNNFNIGGFAITTGFKFVF
jgi:opacity protein-like surface antigen